MGYKDAKRLAVALLDGLPKPCPKCGELLWEVQHIFILHPNRQCAEEISCMVEFDGNGYKLHNRYNPHICGTVALKCSKCGRILTDNPYHYNGHLNFSF